MFRWLMASDRSYLSSSLISCSLGWCKGKGACSFWGLFKMVLPEMWRSVRFGKAIFAHVGRDELPRFFMWSCISLLAVADHLCFVLWTMVDKAMDFKRKIKTTFIGGGVAPKGIGKCFWEPKVPNSSVLVTWEGIISLGLTKTCRIAAERFSDVWPIKSLKWSVDRCGTIKSAACLLVNSLA